MSYTAFERSADKCLNEVQALCRHLTNEGIFNTTSSPTLSQVEEFITDTYHEIGTFLAAYGYNKTQTDTDITGVLQHYNALGAAARCELTQPSVGFKAGENTRYDRLYKEYMKVEGLIKSVGFQRLGASKSHELSAGLSAGGISISDKETIEDDSDFEPYMFTKDGMKHPGIIATEEDT